MQPSKFDKAVKVSGKIKQQDWIDELLKSMGEVGHKKLFNLVYKMYIPGKIQSDFKNGCIRVSNTEENKKREMRIL